MSKKNTGARRDVVEVLKRARARLVRNGVLAALDSVTRPWDGGWGASRHRLLAFVEPGAYDMQLVDLERLCTPAEARGWFDRVISHDEAELKDRGE